MSNSLDPDQVRRSAGSDLGPKCFNLDPKHLTLIMFLNFCGEKVNFEKSADNNKRMINYSACKQS